MKFSIWIMNEFMPRGVMLVGAFVFVAAVGSTACAQRGTRELPHPDDVVINSEFIGKAGEAKKLVVDLKTRSNILPIPNGYQLIGDKSYFVKTDSIDFGESILSFKAAANDLAEFQKIRILYRVATDMYPSGWEWRDCTLSSVEEATHTDPQMSEDRKSRLSRFLPDFPRRTISCNVNERLYTQDNYFAVTTRTAAPPTQPFTQIEVKVLRSEQSPDSKNKIYILSVKNAGEKPAAEVNIYSFLGENLKADIVTPSQGRCQYTRSFSSLGNTVCYLGALAPGSAATIEFDALFHNMTGEDNPVVSNKLWEIWVNMKEKPLDPNWPINRLTFKPLSN